MSPNAFVLVSALIFTFVAAMHAVRAWWDWPVQVGPIDVSVNMSWVACAVSALLAIWGFANL
jgi:hypothetical protein